MRWGSRGVEGPSGRRHGCIQGTGCSIQAQPASVPDLRIVTELKGECNILHIPVPPGRPSWPLPDVIEGNCTSHNSPRFVFPSNSRWHIWGQPRPLGADRCSFLMSCAHMDTRTSGAAMCCLGQASPGEPIQGPRGAGRQQGPASERG